jgi:hypothetical protein
VRLAVVWVIVLGALLLLPWAAHADALDEGVRRLAAALRR